jgi:uncharacterized protein YjbJ (UPF0337 family)
MDWTKIENGWNEYKAAAKQQWDKVSELKLADTLGRREFLSKEVKAAYALTQEETERQVAEWQAKQLARQA